ncbi:hypothetical protein SCHPADRAFT_869471 [Schizopora paradoxa]|uniref:BTB domain-containing protein n=1 Tax=Schizopora paradoxa TaxID=27342 RepID=A0A0H2RYM1_9AGAM|nr:hypothetical protein SCHPADRAFT_869471 [Schizopora paradoxa]
MDVDEQHEEPTRAPEPHDIIWFSDGNVVIKTDAYLFKVHKGVLSMHSTVFKDMFELPNVGNPVDEDITGEKTQDLYDGLPVVALMGDEGEHVVHLLRAIYELRYHDFNSDEAALGTIVALLTLGTKYGFEEIRANVITQISRQFPNSLSEYDSKDFDWYYDIFGDDHFDSRFELLRVAYKTDAQALLPTLYFACSTYEVQYIVEVLRHNFSSGCTETLVTGREKLIQAINDLSWDIPEYVRAGIENSKCSAESHCLEKYRNVRLSTLGCEVDLRCTKGSKVVDEELASICSRCRSFVERAIEKKRKIVWKKIPSFFK